MKWSACATACLVSLGTQVASSAANPQPSPAELSFFEKRIRPVLVNHCYECHSAAKKTKGGLRLDSREALLLGGDSGPAIVPGKPDRSLLITAIRHTDDDLKMPEKKKLPEHEIADLTKWVAMGAPDPRTRESAPIETAGIDYEEGRRFWSFVQPEKQPVPAVSNTDWPRTEVDYFVLAALEAKDMKPVRDAERRTLVRRLYFDLVGLPPTGEQIEAFLTDKRSTPEAVAHLVDQLLDTPYFGERWGRHWLDVSRFSESNGMERNFTYPHAWRYRDYVIASFNKDKPYNQFVREQLAGDLLDEEAAPGTSREERMTATGFLALGPKILNERDKVAFKMEMVDEQIDASTRAVLGLTVSCARCHDHKFDPISIKDYYALAGIFTSTRTLYGTKGGNGNRQAAQLMAIGDEDPSDATAREEHQKKLKATQGKLSRATRQYQNLKKQSARNRGKNPASSSKRPTEKNNPGGNANAGPAKRMADMQKQMAALRKEVAALRKNAPRAANFAMGVAEGQVGDCKICLRGDPKKRGPAVQRGFLTVLHTPRTASIAADSSGRRELAEWMVSRDNPLAARVMVNRIWHHLFGTGLVRTVDNFGKMGERPVNQALLDHLAVSFMETGWSVKTLIRELTTSHVYQLGGDHHPGNYELDPENRLNWQMSQRRLGAEAIRDAILQAGGQLNLSPFRGSVVQRLGDVNYGRNNATDLLRDVANHRSVYLPIIRNAVPESLRVFDFAEPSLIVGRRQLTTVPTQALYLLNDSFVLTQTEAIAERILKASQDEATRVELAYTLTLSRPASTLERERSLKLVRDISAGLSAGTGQERQRVAWATLAQSLIASAEFRYLN